MTEGFPAKVVDGGIAPPVTYGDVAFAADYEDVNGTQETEKIF